MVKVLRMREYIIKARNGSIIMGCILETIERLFQINKAVENEDILNVDKHSVVSDAITLFEEMDGVEMLN